MEKQESDKIGTEKVAGISIGAVLGVALIIVIAVAVFKCRTRKRTNPRDSVGKHHEQLTDHHYEETHQVYVNNAYAYSNGRMNGEFKANGKTTEMNGKMKQMNGTNSIDMSVVEITRM